MKVFITGGTGFIGERLTEKLISENHIITLLVRNPSLPDISLTNRVAFIKGDLSDKEVLKEGMKNCDWVFHMAAFTKPWAEDPSLIAKTNVTGTVNVLEAALECNVKKVVITSTGGTMGYSRDGNPVDESANPEPVYKTMYDRTKAEAEKLAIDFCKKGLEIVIVNPTRVYGPGKLTKSNSFTKIIKLYNSGLWRIIPGDGGIIGNYVFIDDVVEGHILAANSGRSGQRYILGGTNLSFRELFTVIGETAGKKRAMFCLSFNFMKGFIKMAMLFSKISGIPPVLTSDWLDKYMNNWIMSSEKAQKELGYKITPFRTGVSKTIQWIKSQ